jgi:mycothiol synthase
MTGIDAALPAGYTIQTPTPNDAPAIYELVAACSIAETGVVGATREEVRSSLERAAADSGVDVLVALTTDDHLVAKATIAHRGSNQFWVSTDIHPEHQGRGLGAYLLRWTEALMNKWGADAPSELRLTARQQISKTNMRARALVERNGYVAVRHSWRMMIEMAAAPLLPSWPDGVTVRTFLPGQDERAVYEASEEAFADHWDYVREDFEEYRQYFQSEDFDPALTFLAEQGHDIVGVALCQQREERSAEASVAMGWIDSLSVRRPYRRRGIALALMRHIFGEFYHRGLHRVALFVDAQSETGAVDLYRAAGMRPIREWVEYEKEMRPTGVDASDDTGDGEA